MVKYPLCVQKKYYIIRYNMRAAGILIFDKCLYLRGRLRLTNARRLSAYMSSRALATTTTSSYYLHCYSCCLIIVVYSVDWKNFIFVYSANCINKPFHSRVLTLVVRCRWWSCMAETSIRNYEFGMFIFLALKILDNFELVCKNVKQYKKQYKKWEN